MSKNLVVVKSDRGLEDAVDKAEEYAAEGYVVQAVSLNHGNAALVLQLKEVPSAKKTKQTRSPRSTKSAAGAAAKPVRAVQSRSEPEGSGSGEAEE